MFVSSTQSPPREKSDWWLTISIVVLHARICTRSGDCCFRDFFCALEETLFWNALTLDCCQFRLFWDVLARKDLAWHYKAALFLAYNMNWPLCLWPRYEQACVVSTPKLIPSYALIGLAEPSCMLLCSTISRTHIGSCIVFTSSLLRFSARNWAFETTHYLDVARGALNHIRKSRVQALHLVIHWIFSQLPRVKLLGCVL